MTDETTTARDITSGLVHAYRDVRGLNNDAIVHSEIDEYRISQCSANGT